MTFNINRIQKFHRINFLNLRHIYEPRNYKAKLIPSKFLKLDHKMSINKRQKLRRKRFRG